MAPKLTPRPKKATEAMPSSEKLRQRIQFLEHQLSVSKASRHNWQNSATTMRRVQSTLAKDPLLRNALFSHHKGSNIAFVLLPAKDQLRIVKNVSANLKKLARQCLSAQNNATLDPNDPTNLFNQANPNNLANQAQATQAANIAIQNNFTEEEILREDQQALEQQNREEMNHENEERFELTDAEAHTIDTHNQSAYSTPTPKPGHSTSEENDEESHFARKEIEHLGEERAIKHFISGDKKELIEGLKGLEKITEPGVEHAAHAAVAMLTKAVTAA
jgi:hypothetical protein